MYSAASFHRATPHAIRQAKNCSRTFYGCLSRNDRSTDKMAFIRTKSTIVLHGMYLCHRVFEPGYSSPKIQMRFAGNLYAVRNKFISNKNFPLTV